MTQHNYNDSIEACAAHYGDEAEAVKTYMQEGLKQALRLPNRGPIQFLKNGALHPEIREAYSKYGFYASNNFSCNCFFKPSVSNA